MSVPQGLTTDQFTRAAETLHARLSYIGDDIVVQGSRAAGTGRPTSDIDFGVRVDSERFDALIAQRFGTPNPGSAKERTRLHAIQTGKIQAGEAGLSRVRRDLEQQLDMDVDLSVIQREGPFDSRPFIGVPKP